MNLLWIVIKCGVSGVRAIEFQRRVCSSSGVKGGRSELG